MLKFDEPIAPLTLLDDIQQEECDNKLLIEYSTHEKEFICNQVVSLENGNLVLLVEMFINDNFVEIISCSKLMLAKVVQFVHLPIFGVSLLAKVVYYVHPSLFKPPWMRRKKSGQGLYIKCLLGGSPIQSDLLLFLILHYFVLFYFWFVYFNYECMCLGSYFLFTCRLTLRIM